MIRARLIVFAILAAPLLAGAHGDVHEQIAGISIKIERTPNDASLFLRRGELHRVHQDWKLALADFDRAEQLAPAAVNYDFQRGRTLLEAGRPQDAKAVLDCALNRQPEHIEARLVRARALVRLNQPKPAAADFTRALQLAREPQPDWFIERARVQAMPGGDGIDAALRGLDEGARRLGALASFQQTALELELARKNFDGALARLDELLRRSARKEAWLARRGEILEQAGRAEEARRTFEESLAAVAALPAQPRATPAIVELEKRVRAALTRIAGTGALVAGERSK